MIEHDNVDAAVPLFADKDALSEAYEEFVRSFRQVSSDLGALPSSAPIQQYCPWVIALQSAARDANQAQEKLSAARPRSQVLSTRVGATWCRECLRLWDEFRSANRDYFELDNRLDVARFGRDHEVIELMQPLVEESDRRRSELREEIRKHDMFCKRSSGQ